MVGLDPSVLDNNNNFSILNKWPLIKKKKKKKKELEEQEAKHKKERLDALRAQLNSLSNHDLAQEINQTLEKLQILVNIQQSRIHH
jgi:hypothetical protein